jgi:glycosyltransferase involved in cell wall biosynthesis
MKICHLIIGLGNGGAESNLYKIARKQVVNNDVTVVSLTTGGKYKSLLEEEKIEVKELGLRKNPISLILCLFNLLRIIGHYDILQTWMYHADLIGLLVGKLKRVKVVWNIRHTSLKPEENSTMTLIIAKINAWLSGKTDRIICCSEAAYESHVKYGYKASKIVILPNGYDTTKLKYHSDYHASLAKKYQVEADETVILMVARWHKIKNHGMLIKELSRDLYKEKKFKLFLAGPDINENNQELMNLLQSTQFPKEKIYLLGEIPNVETVMSLADILVLPSYSEGFPNVIAEAMACETICIASDVGDARVILDHHGYLIDPYDSQTLEHALQSVFSMSPEEIEIRKRSGRKNIVEKYSIDKIASEYEEIYTNLMKVG